ncbi:MAG: DsbA family protein [Candidatus Acidiferrum sp.]
MIAGQPVYGSEIPAEVQGQIQRLRQQEYELQHKGLEELIKQRLLEETARKEGISKETLLQTQVDQKVTEPTQGEAEAYYLAQKDRQQEPFDEVKASIIAALKQAKIQAAREIYLRGLFKQADVSILLRPPTFSVTYDSARLRGTTNAAVTIVEFSDFSCPFCRRAESTLKVLLAKYQGRVALAYRDFPLRDIHPQAQLAAEASRCAEEQGEFWNYHDMLFQNPRRLGRDDLLQYAHDLKLDEARFASCLQSGEYRSKIEEDVQEGVRDGVSGTPAFFINGVLLAGAQPERSFEEIIDRELSKPTSPEARNK